MTRTNAFSILCVIIRTYAIWLLVTIAIGLPSLFFESDSFARQGQAMGIVVAVSAFQLSVAAILWIFADKFARMALARPQQQVFESDVDVSEWQALAFSVVGVWQVVSGLIFLAHRIAGIIGFYFLDSTNPTRADLPADTMGWLLSEGLRVALGLWLMFGARGLVGLIRRYRAVGHDPVAVEKGSEHDVDSDASSGTPPVV